MIWWTFLIASFFVFKYEFTHSSFVVVICSVVSVCVSQIQNRSRYTARHCSRFYHHSIQEYFSVCSIFCDYDVLSCIKCRIEWTFNSSSPISDSNWLQFVQYVRLCVCVFSIKSNVLFCRRECSRIYSHAYCCRVSSLWNLTHRIVVKSIWCASIKYSTIKSS